MREAFFYNPTVIAIAIGVIVVSTVTLSVVSYHYTVGRENLAETTLFQSNSKLATQYVDRIEQKVIDNDRILSDMVDVNEPSKWPAMVDAIKKNPDLNVEQVYFLRPIRNFPIIYPAWSYDIRNSWSAFQASFKAGELDLSRLAINQPHHLHKERSNNYFFASYILKEDRRGQKILVCFQLQFDKIVALLDKYFRDLQPNFYLSIVDFDNNGVYNQPISRTGKYYYETRFPSTFYKWILQIVPRNYTQLEREVRNQRRYNLFFIILSMSLIFFSLAVIYAAGRKERQLRQLKEDFISNVSHELKTPLALIRMFSEMLVTGRIKNSEAREEYYGIIHNESDRMSRLIDNLLDFSRLERREASKQFERTNLPQLVQKELEAYRYEIQRDGFQLMVEIDDDIPETYADPSAITMGFFNLLDNSVKYSGDGKEIRVRMQRNDGFIDLSVNDQGLGISAGEQDRIFDKFYRGSNAVAHNIRGSGIGLSITKQIAEMHGGAIMVTSEPGRGSTFTLRIPIRQAPEIIQT